jgi:prophage regulatory protein
MIARTTPQQPPRFIRRPEVLRRLALSKSTLYRLIADGSLPRPRRVSPRIVAWPENEIAAYVATRPVAEPAASS